MEYVDRRHDPGHLALVQLAVSFSALCRLVYAGQTMYTSLVTGGMTGALVKDHHCSLLFLLLPSHSLSPSSSRSQELDE